MIKHSFKAVSISILLVLVLQMGLPTQAQAQWPPFDFDLNSVYADGKITYNIEFTKEVGWPMADVVFKIPLPEGARFLEAKAPETTGVDFDGVEVTFFTPVLQRSLKDLSFTVEVADPARTEFTTRAWIAWKGEQPGDYLTGDSTIDISRTPLEWDRPYSRLRLEAGATVEGDVVTYYLYPVNIGGRRMWDVTITLPLPEGTSFLSAEAPPPFESGFAGQQVIFSVLELERRARVEPLRVQLSTDGVTAPVLVTRAWAAFTNVGRNVESQEFAETGDIFVRPGVAQTVIADTVGDTPFPHYDLTSLALQQEADLLRTTFYSAGELEPVGQPLEYFFYIDSDCNADTGKTRGNRGAEHWLRYRHQNGRGYFYDWDEATANWVNRRSLGEFSSAGNTVDGYLPLSYLDNPGQFCWVTAAWNRTEVYHPRPPIEWVGREPRLTEFTSDRVVVE